MQHAAMFAGRVALVTGAGGALGRCVAEQLSRAGASVAVMDCDEKAARDTATFINTRIEAAGLGGGALALATDVTNVQEVRQAVQVARTKLPGRLDIAVNCAGVTDDAFLHKMTEAQWDRVLNINLKGTFVVTQAMADAIKEQQSSEEARGGSIVNLSSIIGKAGNLGQANYAASKAGVVAFTKTAAKELARHNIRVNTILPGFIDTPMAHAVPPKVLAKMVETIPLGRLGQPREIADTCLFLCSDSASFITGAAIEVTGGQHM